MSERFRSPEHDRKQITYEAVDLRNGPVTLVLGDHEMQVISPDRDLKNPEGWNAPYLIVDPQSFNEDDEQPTGYKGLWDRNPIILGREHHNDRFNFSPEVSREHVHLITRDNELIISDLDSTNGTWIVEHKPKRKHGLKQKRTEQPKTVIAESKLDKAVKIAGFSVASEKHPERNEDAFFVDEEAPALGVFDGVGGAPGSELASSLASNEIFKKLRDVEPQISRRLSHIAMHETLWGAHEAIAETSKARNAEYLTTGTVAKIFMTDSGTPFAVIGSVGDSRAYLYRDGQLAHLTLDQAYHHPGPEDEADGEGKQKLLQMTLAEATDLSALSDEARKAFLRRNLVSSLLGMQKGPPVITITDFEVMAGDKLVVTSDGIHDNLTNTEIEQIIGQGLDTDHLVETLVDAARSRSRDRSHLRSKPDDMTAVALTL